jgi:hypothetical protein
VNIHCSHILGGEFQVDGNTNPLVQSFTVENFPLRKAQFSSDGKEVYISSGLIGHFYVYDMNSGNIERVKPNRMTANETIRVSPLSELNTVLLYLI